MGASGTIGPGGDIAPGEVIGAMEMGRATGPGPGSGIDWRREDPGASSVGDESGFCTGLEGVAIGAEVCPRLKGGSKEDGDAKTLGRLDGPRGACGMDGPGPKTPNGGGGAAKGKRGGVALDPGGSILGAAGYRGAGGGEGNWPCVDGATGVLGWDVEVAGRWGCEREPLLDAVLAGMGTGTGDGAGAGLVRIFFAAPFELCERCADPDARGEVGCRPCFAAARCCSCSAARSFSAFSSRSFASFLSRSSFSCCSLLAVSRAALSTATLASRSSLALRSLSSRSCFAFSSFSLRFRSRSASRSRSSVMRFRRSSSFRCFSSSAALREASRRALSSSRFLRCSSS